MRRRGAQLAAGALSALVLLAAGAPGALAQGEPAQPAEPEPGPPQVIFSDRDLRMSRVGIIEVRVGCFGRGGQTCVGTVEARLPEPIRAPSSPRGGGTRLWRPFTLGRGHIRMSAGRGTLLRIRLYPRGGLLVRSAKTIPVLLSARYNGSLKDERTIKVYVPST